MKTKQLYFITLVLMATMLGSCIRDDWHTPDTSGQVTVTLTLQLPGGVHRPNRRQPVAVPCPGTKPE
ncbi:MAG: hypothetical protein LUH15_12025 [Tannerellaceae bacterium]|nr:hypothetical protein [Tannerellaceae bacterium]